MINDSPWSQGQKIQLRHLVQATSLFLFITTLLGSTLPCLAETANDAISKARALQKSQRFDESLDVLEKAKKSQPGNIDLYKAKAQQLAAMSRFDNAVKEYDLALSIKQVAALYAGKAQVALAISRWQDAWANIDKALKLDPKSADALCARSQLSIARHNFSKALADATQAVQLEPQNGAAYLAKATADFSLGKDQKLILSEYAKAISLSDNCAEALAAMGLYQVEALGDVEGFRRLSEASKLQPLDASILAMYGRANRAKKRDADALRLLSAAIKLNPRLSWAYRYLGAEQQELVQEDEAKVSLDKAIELNPYDYDAYFVRYINRESSGDFEGAIKDSNKMIEIEPSSHEGYEKRAGIYFHLNRFEEAIADADKAIARDKEPARIMWIKGDAQMRLKKWKEAEATLNELILRCPYYFSGFEKRAQLYRDTGRFKQSMLDCNKLVAMARKYDYKTKAYKMRASLYEKMGRHDLAEKDRKMIDHSFEDVVGGLSDVTSSLHNVVNKSGALTGDVTKGGQKP